MRRFLLCAVLAACCFYAGAAPHARAGTSTGSNFQTITSPSGYSFQAPVTWARYAYRAVSAGTDVRVTSPDDNEAAATSVVAEPAGVNPSGLESAVPDFVRQLSKGVTSRGGSAVSVFQAPIVASVAGADVSASFTGTYTDEDGVAQVIGGRLALRGTTLYYLLLGAPQSYYSSDPTFSTILDSFQLIAPTIGADLSTPAPAFPLSPEEATSVLLPYTLKAQESLPGVSADGRIAGYGPSSASLLRAFLSAQFSALQSAGYVVQLEQQLMPTDASGSGSGSSGEFVVNLFADTDSARAFGSGEVLTSVSTGSCEKHQ